jgi:hypothetical protein
MGTPDYSAPEQATDARSADIRADIYSLGCTLYCLLAGKPPFQGGTDIQTILAHLEKHAQPLPEVRPDVPAELWAVVERMLAKAPAHRYQKPAEVAQALAPFCKAGSSASAPVLAPTGVSSPGRATPTPHDTKLLAGAAKGGAALEETEALPSVKRRQPAPAAAARAKLPLLLIGGAVAATVAVAVLAVGVWLVAAMVFRPSAGQVALPATHTAEQPAAEETGFVPLFNGKDLAGWKAFDPKTLGQWKVQDGVLTCSGPPSYLFSERSDFQNFRFRVEAMINDSGDSGQLFRAQFGPGTPRGYEAQIDIIDKVAIKTGSLFLPDVPQVLVSKALHRPGEWFTQEVIADGNHILVKVNGETTVDWSDPEHRYSRGNFALQHHDPSTVVKFRKVEVKELPATLVTPPAVTPGFVSLFNGKDLKGWRTHQSQRGKWEVKDGVLIGSGPQDSYLYTDEDDFVDFELHVEAKVNDGGNSGVFFRAGSAPTLPPRNPHHPSGYEVQINSTHADLERTGSLFAYPGGCVASHRDRLIPAGRWFTLDIRAEGDHINVKVDGKTTADFTNQATRNTRGTIALEHLDARTVVEFRKLEVKRLPPRAPGAGGGKPG